MSRKQQLSIEVLSPLIAEIHEAGMSEKRWPAVLRQIADLAEAPSNTLWKQTSAGELRDIYTANTDCRVSQDYAQYFYKLDFLFPAVTRAPVQTLLSADQVQNHAVFAQGEFYNDFVRKHCLRDCIQVNLIKGDRHAAYFAITNSGIAGTDDFRFISILVPHLAHAMRSAQQLNDLQIKRDAALEALDLLRDAILIVDGRGRLLLANRAGEALLRKRQLLVANSSGLRLVGQSPQHAAALQTIIRQTTAIGDQHVDGDTPFKGALRLDHLDLGPILLRALPLRAHATWNPSPRAAALLIVTALADQISAGLLVQMRRLFGLTHSEAAVAGQIGQGIGVGSAADELKVTAATLRWHLQRVFAKTGTSRQSELARLVERLSSVGAIPTDVDG